MDVIMVLAFFAPPVGSLVLGLPMLTIFLINTRLRGKNDPWNLARNCSLVSAVALSLSIAAAALGPTVYSTFAAFSTIAALTILFVVVIVDT